MITLFIQWANPTEIGWIMHRLEHIDGSVVHIWKLCNEGFKT